jgi:hypothetical protein
VPGAFGFTVSQRRDLLPQMQVKEFSWKLLQLILSLGGNRISGYAPAYTVITSNTELLFNIWSILWL